MFITLKDANSSYEYHIRPDCVNALQHNGAAYGSLPLQKDITTVWIRGGHVIYVEGSVDDIRKRIEQCG